MYWHHNDWGPGAWALMATMMILFWSAVAAVVAYAIRARHHATTQPRPDDTTRILDERFARGEIDDDEYQRRRELLRSK